METSTNKHGIFWWVGRVFLWIVFFPVMLALFLIKMKKLPLPVKIPFLLAHVGIWAGLICFGFMIDREPPVIEVHAASVDYGSVLYLKDLAEISDNQDDSPSMAITYCDPKAGTIGEGGQSVTFSKIGTYMIKVTGQDKSENAVEAEIPVKVSDGTPPVIKAKKAEVAVLEGIPVSELATVKDEVDSSPKLRIIACDGNAEIAKGGKSIVFKETGDYQVGVMATDSSDNGVKDKVAVKVFNHTKPGIKLSESAISIKDTDKAVDFKTYVSAESAVYGDMTDDVVIDSSAVRYEQPGKYTVQYTITDKDGNSNNVTQEVTVLDTTPPTISAFQTEFVLTEGDDKPDYLVGLNAEDRSEGDLTAKVAVDDSAVDYNKAGTYTVVYTVTDSAGNTARSEAAVTVQERIVERAAPAEENTETQYYGGNSGQETVNRSVQENHPDTDTTAEYILNSNTGKFHYPWCASVKTMKEKNAIYFEGTREEAIARGYDPCKKCNP